jgi:hypothetical protein
MCDKFRVSDVDGDIAAKYPEVKEKADKTKQERKDEPNC